MHVKHSQNSSGGSSGKTARDGASVTALWRLKLALEPDGVQPGAYLISTAATVSFNNDSEHWLDVAAFEEGVGLIRTLGHATANAQDWQRAEGAIGQYTGDLLEGFYDDWAIRERERLRLLYLDSLADASGPLLTG